MNNFTIDELNGLKGLWEIEKKNLKSRNRIYHELRIMEKNNEVKKAKYARVNIDKCSKRLKEENISKDEIIDLKNQILQSEKIIKSLENNQKVIECLDLLRKKEKIDNRERTIKEKLLLYSHDHEYFVEHYNKQTHKTHIRCAICGMKMIIPINETNASKIENNIEIYTGNDDSLSLARINYFKGKRK